MLAISVGHVKPIQEPEAVHHISVPAAVGQSLHDSGGGNEGCSVGCRGAEGVYCEFMWHGRDKAIEVAEALQASEADGKVLAADMHRNDDNVTARSLHRGSQRPPATSPGRWDPR